MIGRARATPLEAVLGTVLQAPQGLPPQKRTGGASSVAADFHCYAKCSWHTIPRRASPGRNGSPDLPLDNDSASDWPMNTLPRLQWQVCPHSTVQMPSKAHAGLSRL